MEEKTNYSPIKRLRSHLDLSEEDICQFPEQLKKWIDLDYLCNRIEYYDLGDRIFTRNGFNRSVCLGEKIIREREGCIDPLSGASFDGWDNRVASIYSRY